MVGTVAARFLLAATVAATPGVAAAQEPSRVTPYDSLTATQRRLLEGWASGKYDAAPEPFKAAFGHVTARLSSILLSDPENGEVLGAALDLVESVEPLERQPVTGDAPSTLQIAVTLASGARDRLRRSGEFERVSEGAPDRVEFLYAGPPAVRISADARGAAALITVLTR